MRITRTRGLVAVGLASALALTACAAPAEETDGGTDLEIGAIDLAAAGCPANVKIATDWFPEAEHGHLYELVGPDPTFEATSEYSVTGPLMASGEYTGVDVTIVSGGSARPDFLQPDGMLYAEEDILLGYVGNDEAVVHSNTYPTIGIFAPLEKDPQMIMWDPATLTDVETIADLGEAGTSIRVFPGGYYIDYFTSSGVLSTEQIDSTYDGAPDVFVASGGTIAQQGFASAEPYIYENEISAWGKPVAFELINDAGYPKYAAVVSTKPENVTEYADCFAALVPVLQQAEVDYYADPAETNELILAAVEAYATFWVYSAAVADYSVETQLEIGLVSNGHDDIIGNVDPERVQALIDIATGMYADDAEKDIRTDLTVEDLFTDQFIDPSIGL
ncbi:ABC transporter substrate-binding protein [Pseudolysinimonas yzui]|uniref:Nitrate ABC transporter substrate-binding protein n=1 Tax=Pseudolysinimonas yzui TaxID=2708254 RepID=A0A8J3GN08_9MICO|nr:ABC transporter substrate-binding protein [Pseudolysinimonas yzui]GHF05010.1 nitrate ABC transporter substrate-binding protein [Pseudolysinimonas yzui]